MSAKVLQWKENNAIDWSQLMFGPIWTIKACLHVPSLSPCPSPSPSKFNIVPMVTVRFTGRMGTESILSVKQSVSIDTMINFDGNGVGTCKQALILWNLNDWNTDHNRYTLLGTPFESVKIRTYDELQNKVRHQHSLK